MKHITRAFVTSAVSITLLSAASMAAADSAARTPSSGAGIGATTTLNQNDEGLAGGPGADAKATGMSRGADSPRSNSRKTNGLNMGTNSGANSDVKSGLSRSKQNGR